MTTWIITGASGGLGTALALDLLDRGHMVIGTARDPGRLASLAERYPDRFHAMPLDLADLDAAPAFVRAAEDRAGPVDVLVNNVGQTYFSAVEEGEDAAVRSLFEANFFGPVALARAVLPGMRARRSGTIVNLSSVSGLVAFPGMGYYSASKFALEGLTEALWQEVEPLGLRVMLVEPGSLRTGINGRSPRAPRIEGCAPPADQMLGFLASAGETIEVGDPVKAAAAIITAVEADMLPKRLLLGSDAYRTVTGKLATQLADYERVKAVSLGIDVA